MKKFFKTILCALTGLASFSACTEKVEPLPTNLQVKVNMPVEFTAAYGGEVTITSESINKTYKAVAEEGVAIFEDILPGVYNVQVSKKMDRKEAAEAAPDSGIADNVMLNGITEGVTVAPNADTVAEIELSWSMDSGLLITKIYCNGTELNSGNRKNGPDAKFFEITNNTAQVKYLDGLCLGAVHGNITSQKSSQLYLKYKDEATYVTRIVRVPGTEGQTTNYPLEPGQTITIAWSAQNYIVSEAGANQCTKNSDLTHADFEIDQTDKTQHTMLNVDNVNVPNVTYAHECDPKTPGFFSMNQSLVIFYASQEQIDGWVTDVDENSYSVAGQKTWKAKRVPNKIILDAVEAYKTGHKLAKRTPDILDAGGVHGLEVAGQVYVRKIEKIEKGRMIFQDTNNSTNDFVVLGSKGNFDGSHLVIRKYDFPEIQPAK